MVANYDFTTKLLVGFMKREEVLLRKCFKNFGLEKTGFELEYATVKPNKWDNYGLYANCDMPYIKRVKAKGKK